MIRWLVERFWSLVLGDRRDQDVDSEIQAAIDPDEPTLCLSCGGDGRELRDDPDGPGTCYHCDGSGFEPYNDADDARGPEAA